MTTITHEMRRVLFCHAHPDDETIATGALIAHLADAGKQVQLVTATRGEMGEVVPAVADRVAGKDLEEHRMGELAGALAVLGVERHAFLGTAPARAAGLPERRYRDSGMEWIRPGLAGPADTTDARAFSVAPLEQEVADLLALLDTWQPEVLVSYDAEGGYGHPDHVRMHQVARAAAQARGLPFVEVRHHRGPGVEWFEYPELLDRVATALRHHASQLTVLDDGATLQHVGGQTEPIAVGFGLAAG
ncbi:PIG-L family deacetylase [Luteococcus peritonei]|uniref:PIG-L family deacetylase n=1 Tax=Luteococcus peritonei TaxID=88874 RepID=A0ABW4RTB6_9ACTN